MHDDKFPARPSGGDARMPPGADGTTARSAGALPETLSDTHRDDRDEIDLLAYWHVLVKRRWLILSILGMVAAASLLITLIATPIYRATAVMQIEKDEQTVVQVGAVGAQGFDPDFLQTQYQLLQSRTLAERVADDLGLDAAELERLAQPGLGQRIRRLTHPAPEATVAIRQANSRQALRSATQAVRQGLSIEPVRNSRLVRIHYDSPVPEASARVANGIADGFIASGLERRFGASSYAKTYLEDQLRIIKARLENSERQLVAFAQKENLVSSLAGQSLASQNLSELNSSLATAQDQRIRAQARWTQAQAAKGSALPADMLSDSIIRKLQEQRAELRGTYQEKLQIYKPAYPEMLQLKGQLDDIDRQIGTELSNIRASVKAEYDAAASQERLLQSQLNRLRTEALDVDDRSIEYNILKREVDTNRQLYDNLLQRFKEVGVAGDVRSNNVSIVDRAEVPTQPYKPNLGFNLAVGLLAGLVLGTLAAFLLEFFDDTLKTPDDVEQHLKLAVLGIIPKLVKQSPLEAALDLRSAYSESYRSVRTALQFSTDHGVPRVLLITSSGPGEGKSTTSLTLARNFAQMGKRVLLLESDLRNPSLQKLMGIAGDVGLSNILAGSHVLSDAIRNTSDELLKVIFAGPLPPNPSELLSGPKLISLLELVAGQYDLVIIDAPPIMGIADAPILANAVDGTMIVVQSGRTRIATAKAAVKHLQAARAHIVGSVLTHYDAKLAGYGYSYEGYYGYGDPRA
ncbi:MAG: polysaccharide biosynthesis tyrosine autokinase [Luteimonas sp.]